MAISNVYEANFKTLKRAFKNGDVCLLECQDAATGKTVIAVCAISKVGEEYTFAPLAKMFDGNPYEELNPPDPDGGYRVNGDHDA